MKKTLLTVFTLLTFALVNAQEFTTPNGVIYTITDTTALTAELKDGSGLSGDVVLGSTANYEGNDYTITSIGNNAFKNVTSITSITLPSEAESIGGNAFLNCTVSSVILPTKVTLFKNNAFKNSGITEITFPDSVNETSFNQKSFTDCVLLETITLPVGITAIGDQSKSKYEVFKGASSLKTVNNFGDVQTVGNGVFQNAPLLSSIDISGMTYINANSFNGCAALTSVTLNSNLTGIAKQAFMGTGIKSVVIPNTVTEILIDAFKDCTSLKDVQVDHVTPLALDVVNVPIFTNTDTSAATLHVPTGTTGSYQNADVWSAFGTFSEEVILGTENNLQYLNLSFYPNPTNGIVTISNIQEKNIDVTVYDLNGRALLNTTNSQVDISNLTSGVYLFKVKAEKSEVVKRIVKQ